MGYYPYLLRRDIAEHAEGQIVYPLECDGDVAPCLTLLRNVLVSLEIPEAAKELKASAPETVNEIQVAVDEGVFAEAYRTGRPNLSGWDFQWSPQSHYLIDFLATCPRIGSRRLKKAFREAYMKVCPDDERIQAELDGPRSRDYKPESPLPPESRSRSLLPSLQYEIVTVLQSGMARERTVKFSKSLERLDRVLAELISWMQPKAEARRWQEAGQLLGQSLWTVWCPIPEEYSGNLPAAYHELRNAGVFETLPGYDALWPQFTKGDKTVTRDLEDVFAYPHYCQHWREFLISEFTRIADNQIAAFKDAVGGGDILEEAPPDCGPSAPEKSDEDDWISYDAAMQISGYSKSRISQLVGDKTIRAKGKKGSMDRRVSKIDLLLYQSKKEQESTARKANKFLADKRKDDKEVEKDARKLDQYL